MGINQNDFMNDNNINDNEDVEIRDYASEFGFTDSTENIDEEFSIFTQGYGVSGMGIVDVDNDDDNLDDILSTLNSNNQILQEEEERRMQEERLEAERRDAEIRAERLAENARIRAEEERLERERIEREEAEELERLEREAQERKEKSILTKMKKMVDITNTKKSSESTFSDVKEEEKEDISVETKEDITAKENNNTKKEKPVSTVKKDKQKEEKPKLAQNKKKIQPKQKDYQYLATHDSLTALQNMHALEDKTEKYVKAPKDSAVIFFDVNNLKTTNDTLGHEYGNRLIITVAETIKVCFGEQNSYRIGGDEFLVFLEKGGQKATSEKIPKFQSLLKKAEKEDSDGIEYSASVGFAVSDGKVTFLELKNEADKRMYANKKAYKSSHPKKEPKPQPKDVKPVEYDSLLTEDQKLLKSTIKENHTISSDLSTEKIMREIQSKAREIAAILIAGATFDHLFIIQDVDNFMELVDEMDNLIDYSYLYVVYENGTRFYGLDEYYDEVTNLFQEIGKTIINSPYITQKDILKINGINIFKNIYFD